MVEIFAGLDLVEIIGGILLIATSLGLFAKVIPALSKVSKFLPLIKEGIDILLVGVPALMDGKLTVVEKKALRKEIDEFIAKWNELKG